MSSILKPGFVLAGWGLGWIIAYILVVIINGGDPDRLLSLMMRVSLYGGLAIIVLLAFVEVMVRRTAGWLWAVGFFLVAFGLHFSDWLPAMFWISCLASLVVAFSVAEVLLGDESSGTEFTIGTSALSLWLFAMSGPVTLRSLSRSTVDPGSLDFSGHVALFLLMVLLAMGLGVAAHIHLRQARAVRE